ncbi:serine/threonine-protein kinase [Streptomyces sp. A7024]|uniref:Serine/threonine-protein kinase n=1 Tax=Streptomyces coryli TaxID=1128680 RepID=A0A6G4U932_9ACTN|nr:serine/threonine-protein kinase [Streptomyces coryli]NGN68694.1 serine/threonine-protein kinase [Streptomyces coryli]
MGRGTGEWPVIPGYRIESLLGSGGMGRVYLGRSSSGRRVAVKVIREEIAHQPDFRERFRREITSARRVSGAFTAPVVDADPDAEPPWMATLYIPGPSLDARVRREGPLAGKDLHQLAAGLAEALLDLHRAGIVHRDLKPGNVLLAEDGPRVIDFGVVRPGADSAALTRTGVAIGTPPYMSPEQVRAQRYTGPESDIFSYGSVLAFAATGRAPFEAADVYAVAYRLVHEHPDLAGVPEWLRPVLHQCLQKDPALRPSSADLLALLGVEVPEPAPPPAAPEQVVRSNGPRTPPPPPRTGRGRVRGRRSRRMLAAAGAVTVTAVLAAAGAFALLDDDGKDGGSKDKGAVGSAPVDGGRKLGDAYQPVNGGSPGGSAGYADSRGRKPSGWEPWEGGRDLTGCAYAGGSLYCAANDAVLQLAATTGAERWSRPLTGPVQPPAVSGGMVVVSDGEGLRGLSTSGGAERWSFSLPTPAKSFTVSAGIAYASTQTGSVYAIDAKTGHKLWAEQLNGGNTSFATGPRVRALGETGYLIGSTSGQDTEDAVRVVNRHGKTSAEHKLPEGGCAPDTAAVSLLQGSPVLDCLSYKDDQPALLHYAFAARSHTLTPLDADPRSGLAVQGGRAYVVAGQHLLVVDGEDKQVVGRVKLSDKAVADRMAIVAAGGRVYFGTHQGLYAVDPAEGKVVWNSETGSGPEQQTPPATPLVAGGVLFAAAPKGGWVSVDTRS